MTEPTLYLTEADVVSLVDLTDTIDALEDTCAAQGRGETLEIPKALGTFGDASSLHALGSAIPSLGLGGFKTWINTKRGAVSVMSVFDVEQGRLSALIEAGSLGQLRTSAIAGVATRWMARQDADEMALVGTGRQAMMQVAAVAAVRPIRRLRVYSRTADNRRTFVEKARAAFPFAVEESMSLEAALSAAPIVTLVTRATQPFVHAGMLARGSHLNAVGAILPANSEFDQDVFDRTSLIAVDSVVGVQRNSREFIDRFGSPGPAWEAVKTLGELIIEGNRRPENCELSLFKAMGMGISDLAVARLVIERARKKGMGLKIAEPRSAAPRWRAPHAAAAD